MSFAASYSAACCRRPKLGRLAYAYEVCLGWNLFGEDIQNGAVRAILASGKEPPRPLGWTASMWRMYLRSECGVAA